MKVLSTTKAPAAIGPYSQGYEAIGFCVFFRADPHCTGER